MTPAPLPPGKKNVFCTLPPQMIMPPAPLPPGNNSFIFLYAKVLYCFCLITPNFHQSVGSVQYSAVLKVYLCCHVLSTPGFWWGKLCSIPVIQSFAGLLKTKQRWDLPDLDPLWWLSANWYLLVAMVMAYVCLIRGLRHNFNIVSLITPNFRQYSAVFGLRFT